MWQRRRGQPDAVNDVRALVNAFDYLRGAKELLAAQRLSVQLQIIGDEVKKNNPAILSLIELKLSYLDDDFERYDSALRRFDTAMEIVKLQQEMPLEIQFANRVLRANYLRKLGKHDEAERFYLQYLKDAREHPKFISRDEVISAEFELAAMYADMGAYEQYDKVMPKEATDFYEVDGKPDPRRVAFAASSYVKYYTFSERKNSEIAAKHCQKFIDQMQFYYGVSSPKYVEATELMAKVRIEQRRYNDAIELLKKSSQIRAGLFGSDHPSIARLHAEIDQIGKLSLADSSTVRLPADSKK